MLSFRPVGFSAHPWFPGCEYRFGKGTAALPAAHRVGKVERYERVFAAFQVC